MGTFDVASPALAQRRQAASIKATIRLAQRAPDQVRHGASAIAQSSRTRVRSTSLVTDSQGLLKVPPDARLGCAPERPAQVALWPAELAKPRAGIRVCAGV